MIENIMWFLLLWIGATGLNIVLFAYLSAKYNSSSYLIAGVATYFVLANILATKIIQIWRFVVPSGVVVYSMIFLISDLLSEKYGKEEAKKGAYAGVLMNLMFIIIIYLAKISPPLSSPEGIAMSERFNSIFTFTIRIILASITAFIFSQLFNITIFHLIRNKTGSKMLWLRNNVSTISAQLIDTLIFITVSFYKVVPGNILLNMILTQYLIKVIIAALSTPFLYLGDWIYDHVS